MQRIKAVPGERICIGYEGEHLARQVCIDISEWVDTYGAGSAELIYRRPGDENAYPVAAECVEKTVLWTVTATDTARAGLFGQAELRYYVGETLVKSAAGYVTVLDAMGVPMEPPDEPAQAWLDEVLASGVVAKEHRDAAEAAREDATVSACVARESAVVAEVAKEQTTESELAATQSEKNAKAAEEAAALSEQNAKVSEQNAIEAARRAELSNDRVEQAEANAAKSAEEALAYKDTAKRFMQSAETAKSQAQTYMKSAYNSATAAEDSEANAKTYRDEAVASAQEAKEAAQRATGIQSVNGVKPDENGNVEIETGEGGGVSSWNDLTDKPFYEETGMVEALVETDATESTDPTFGKCWVISKAPYLTVGETYTVMYNGVPYNCVCHPGEDTGLSAAKGAFALGNFSVVGGANTGEPFAMLVFPDISIIALDLTSATSVRIGITGEGEIVHKLDEKFLPCSIYTVVVDSDAGTNTTVADKTYAEVAAKVKDPTVQVRAFVNATYEGVMVYRLNLNFTEYDVADGTITFTAPSNEFCFWSMTMKNDGSINLGTISYKGLDS